MKGYFSKLAQHTGLNFGPGAKGESKPSTSESRAEASRLDREEITPLHVEAITSSDSRDPGTAGRQFDNVAALESGDASGENPPLQRSVDPAVTTSNESPPLQRSVDPAVTTCNESATLHRSVDPAVTTSNESATVHRSVDPAVTTSNESATVHRSIDPAVNTSNSSSRSTSSADNFPNLNEPTPVPKSHSQGTSAAARDNFTISETRVVSQTHSRAERPTAGVRQIIQSSEEPSLEKENPSREEPRGTPDTLIEISPRASPEESRIRFIYSDSNASQPRVNSAEPSLGPSLVEFSEEQSPVSRTPTGTERVEEVAELESQFAAPDSVEHYDRNQARPRLETEGQELLQLVLDSATPRAALGERSEQEAAIRNYINEVRAWVAASPTAERALEPDDWSELRSEPANVFALERETDAAPISRHERAADTGAHDLSLSIGNISIVIEEPKQDAPPLPAAPPSGERLPVQIASEPTSLSRYYLRSW